MLKPLFSKSRQLRLGLILIGLMFLLPFINIYHDFPIVSFYSEWIAGALGLAATGMQFLTARPIIQAPKISLLFLALGLILLLQWTAGIVSTANALMNLSYFIWAFLLAVLGKRLREEFGWDHLAHLLAVCLTTAGCLNGLLVMVQIIARTGGTVFFLPDLQSFGALPQSNHFANFIALCTASLIYLYINKRVTTAFFTVVALWFLLMLAISGSRSAWLYLAALTLSALLMYIPALKQGQLSSKHRALLFICLATLPLFGLVHFFSANLAPAGLFNLSTDRIVNGINMDTPSVRLQIWYDSLRLFLQSPWLGIGAGNLNAATFLLLDQPTAMSYKGMFEHAHNLFLQLLAEMGIGAVLITLFMLFGWCRRIQWRELDMNIWWAISLLMILGIHSMLEYPLWYAYFLGVAALLLGAAEEKTVLCNAGGGKAAPIHKILHAGLALLIICGALMLGLMFIAHNKLTQVIYQSTLTNESALRKELDWVKRYTLLSPYAELLFAVSAKPADQDIDRQLALNQTAIDFKPFSKVCYQQVVLLKLRGKDAEAKQLLKRTLIVYPDNLQNAFQAMPAVYQRALLAVLEEVDAALATKMAGKITNASVKAVR